MQENSHRKSIIHLLEHCGSLRSHEALVIICDPQTNNIAQLFAEEALHITPSIALYEIPMATKHGEDPPENVQQAMLSANLVISLCTFSLAHSQARISANRQGVRFLSMPLYTMELLGNPAILVDYNAQLPVVEYVTQKFTEGKTARVTTRQGTDIVLGIADRAGNCCPGFVTDSYLLGSPPDIESNVSPIEDQSEGIVVIDGSITCPELGLLTDPVILTVEKGRITRFESANADYVKILDTMFSAPDSKRRVLAECGVGLNPLATLTGTMLTDEGAMGCMHFGFGSNYTVGGKNKVDFHLDFVFRDASLFIDGVPIIAEGKLCE